MGLHLLNDREKFIVARWAYSVGKPIITDAEYTVLLRYMESAFPNDEYVTRSWSSDPCPTDLLNRINRQDLIVAITLTDKTESIPSLNTLAELQSELISVDSPGTLSMKHDGWNLQANYYNGELVLVNTRGRSSDFKDVSFLKYRLPQTIPVLGKVKIVMEMTVSKNDFIQCAKLYGNVSERAAVATLLAHPESSHLLSFHAFDIHGYDFGDKCKFEVLKEWGFDIPRYYHVTDYDSILNALKMLSDEYPSYSSPTDGVVYDGEIRRAIRLLSWEEPIYKSFVIGYLEQYGPHRISPSVLIHPILRGGVTQKRVNVTNWQRIMDYNLQPGAPIAFRVASSATADFDEESTRLLHKQYVDNWEEYQNNIKEEESLKACSRALLLST